MGMTEIGRQLGDLALDVTSLAIPAKQRPHRKAMSFIPRAG